MLRASMPEFAQSCWFLSAVDHPAVPSRCYEEGAMAKANRPKSSGEIDALVAPVVAATLAGVIYQAQLQNRQARLNIADEEVTADVVSLWHTVRNALRAGPR